MRALNIITTALIFRFATACTVDPLPESEPVLEEETLEDGEVLATRGRCEDAVDEGADFWRLMCGAAMQDTLFTPPETAHCLGESSEGRGAGKAKCRSSCPTACMALVSRWQLYCEEHQIRLPLSICEKARKIGMQRCLSYC